MLRGISTYEGVGHAVRDHESVGRFRVSRTADSKCCEVCMHIYEIVSARGTEKSTDVRSYMV